MIIEFNSFAIALIMTGVAAFLMSLILYQRTIEAVRWFSAMMFCSGIWAIAYAFELSSHTLNQMLFWIDIEYLGIAIIPATWIVFIIKFIGRDEWLNLRNKLLIFSFPAIALILVWTNRWHHFHYASVSLDTTGPFPLLDIHNGPWYYVHAAYFYSLLTWGMYLLLNKFRKADRVYKRQNFSILIGAIIPWLVNIAYLLGYRPYAHIDLTPYAFIATSIIIGFGLMRLKLFDVVPLARQKVFADVREGILVLDDQGRVIDQNTTMETFLSHFSTRIVGKPLDEIMPLEYRLHLLISKHTINKIDLRLKHDLVENIYEVAITPLYEKENVLIGTLLIFWDITERQHTEDKLKEQAEQLTILNRLKDKMFTIISHDIRSPMASLKGILTIAEEGMLTDAEFRSFLPQLSKNVGATYDLLDNLLHWSRSQLQGEKVYQELFDLKELTWEKTMFFEKKATEKKILLEDRVVRNTMVYSDKNMIRIVLHNLIGNAIKFCNAGNKITLSSLIEGEETIISVCDTGVGMSDQVMEKLFEFGTTSSRGTQGEQGTGLGLVLCKEFIEKNGGRIWVESKPNEGSQFFFTIRNKPKV